MTSTQHETLFSNPFLIEDLAVFDDATLLKLLDTGGFGLTLENLALGLRQAPPPLVERIACLLSSRRSYFMQELYRPASESQIEAARQLILDKLFWDLTYWKTPDLYDELTEGEQVHPGIFQQLEPDLCGKAVLDAGAGSGRATFECIRHGARLVYAVEPSPGLIHILERKIAGQVSAGELNPGCVNPLPGCFDHLPLQDHSVDLAISCSAFTATPEQGGEPGLAELKRVTRPGGKIVLIWPRIQDYYWLGTHGFTYVALPLQQEMHAHFRSLESALRCAHRFYAHNEAVVHYILTQRSPTIPFSVLGINPPCDYCWLEVHS